MKIYPSNTLIIKQGKVPIDFMFVKSGSCQLIRKIGFKLHAISNTLSTKDFSDPTKWDYEMGYAKDILL